MHLLGKIIKYLILAAVLGGLIFVLLNFSYFSKQVVYLFDQVFVTEEQREYRRTENPVQQQPNEIYIPTLDIRAPIIYTEETEEAELQKALQKGVVKYAGTADIGTVGNTYLFGHSSDFAFAAGDYKTVFALLPNIQIGAEIYLTNAQGKVFRYKVYEKFVAEKTATHLLNQETYGRKIVTLQTSYPVGTALQRYIVKAEIVEE